MYVCSVFKYDCVKLVQSAPKLKQLHLQRSQFKRKILVSHAHSSCLTLLPHTHPHRLTHSWRGWNSSVDTATHQLHSWQGLQGILVSGHSQWVWPVITTPLCSKLCTEDMTAFEPEACAQLVTGMEFHKFYFDHCEYPHTSHTLTSSHPHSASFHVSCTTVYDYPQGSYVGGHWSLLRLHTSHSDCGQVRTLTHSSHT